MKKKIECEIMAHENGWAVLVGSVMEAVYPSRYLAVTSAKARHMDFILVDEAMPLRHSTTDVMATDRAPQERPAQDYSMVVFRTPASSASIPSRGSTVTYIHRVIPLPFHRGAGVTF